jgi:hypothetical protein
MYPPAPPGLKPFWTTTLAALLQWLNLSPSQLGLTPTNSDFAVTVQSQLDQPAGANPPAGLKWRLVNNCAHTDEVGHAVVAYWVARGLDLLYNYPTQSKFEGYTFFNPGF